MKKRIITGLIMLLVLTPIVAINSPSVFIIFQIMMGLFVFGASLEFINMYEKEKKISTATKVVIIALTVLTFINTFLSLGTEWSAFSNLPLASWKINHMAILMLTIISLLSLLVFVKEFTPKDVGKSLTIITYIGMGSAAISALRFLGVRVIVYVVLISTFTDVFAYFIGIKFGKHKMIPHISPKKTWEGAIGGTIIATVVASSFAIFYGKLFPSDIFLGEWLNKEGWKTIFDGFSSLGQKPLWLQFLVVVPITLLGSIGAQIGDLVASKFKRTYEIKDFGTIFPGHGGVMDRFDSILFISLLFVGIILGIQTIFPV
ncbi:CTP:phosphatidate cytidylyltransferase [Alteracholeplasma palmae J233]|uniref:Phosphatidate cytidylyltransferase n=1 Tax=Alteracholeplasma palmae (strain ATCC 49389 / J233) TaxID=1318466 RepID=U4KNR9_ALTPJ|nr:CTP--phosphatidate cytidylyltransferase [Alteracholeplasma palmae]CCV63855.1 CTP:phosphatidate cytidylyltransferase [Alteracholeplasma palmae J233]